MITPPSLLATLEAHTGFSDTRVPRRLVDWVRHDFDHARYARLGQAGHDGSTRLALAQVFTDIEVGAGPGSASGPTGDAPLAPGFVATMLKRRPAPAVTQGPSPRRSTSVRSARPTVRIAYATSTIVQ